MPSEPLTRENFNDAIYDHDIVIIDFFTKDDTARDEFEEVLEVCSKTNSDVFFASCDLEQVPEAASAFSIVSTPTLAVFRDHVLLIMEPCARRSDPLRDHQQLQLLLTKIRELNMSELVSDSDAGEAEAGASAGDKASAADKSGGSSDVSENA